MKTGLIVAMVLGLFVTGCATRNDRYINQDYMWAEILIAQAKGKAIEAQSGAIEKTITAVSTDLERYLARQQIADLEVTKSGIEAPTNGNDVAIAGVGELGGLMKTGVAGAVGWKTADVLESALKGRGTTTVTASKGSTVNISDTENHTTAIGNDTSAISKEPVVIDKTPEVVEEEEAIEPDIEEEVVKDDV